MFIKHRLYLTYMKFKIRIVLASLFFLPGLYAVIAWTLNDLQNRHSNWSDEETAMNRLFPVFALSIRTKMFVLLLVSLSGVLFLLKSPVAETKSQRKIRVALLITGILLIMVLSFPFM